MNLKFIRCQFVRIRKHNLALFADKKKKISSSIFESKKEEWKLKQNETMISFSQNLN